MPEDPQRSDRIFGEFLVDRGVFTPDDLHRHLAEALARGNQSLGERLVEAGILDARTCKALLREVKSGLRPCAGCGRPMYVPPEERGSDARCAECADTTAPPRDAPLILPVDVEDPAGASLELERFGKYEIVQQIARGGMGIVYRAHDPDLGRDVALKILRGRRQASPSYVERFRREAQSVARLSHPNIVGVHAFGREGDSFFFTMELLEGASFEAYLKAGPPPPEGDLPARFREGTRILRDVAAAVGYAHSEGVVHRDLKPANILLTRGGVPKVTDFGLARDVIHDTMTQDGDVIGTPLYMAPEQIAGKRAAVGPWTDTFALGIMLYELLTGTHPFRAQSMGELQRRIVRVDPVPPRDADPRVPIDLSTIAMKALAKDPERRYRTGTDLRSDLDLYLEGLPIAARPPSTASRLAFVLARRRGWQAAAAGLLGVAVLAALGIFIFHGNDGGGSGDPEEVLRAVAIDRAYVAAAAHEAEGARARADSDGAVRHAEEALDRASALVRRVAEAGGAAVPAEFGAAEAAAARDAIVRLLAAALVERHGPGDAARAATLIEGLPPAGAADLVLLGRAHLAAGNLGPADAAAERALAGVSPDLDAFRLRAAIREAAFRHEDAAAEWSHILDVSPRDVEALVGRGRALLAMGRATEAAGDARAALDADPSAPAALALLAEASFAQGDRLAARRALDRASVAAADAAPVLAARARMLAASGLPAEAAATLDVLVRRREDDPALHLLRGTCRLLVLDLAGAREDLDQAALGPAPVAREACWRRVELLLVDGRDGDARQALAEARQRFPEDPRFPVEEGWRALWADDPEAAQSSAERAVAMAPEDPRVLILAAACRREAGDGRGAQDLLDRAALYRAPSSPSGGEDGGEGSPLYLAELGAARLLAGDARGAEEAYRRSLSFDGRPASFALLLYREAKSAQAAARVEGVRPAAAREATERATARFRAAALLDPGFVEARLDLARCLVDLGDAAGARAEVDRILYQNPYFASAYTFRSDLAARAGDLPRAISDLSAVLDLDGFRSSVLVERARYRWRAGDLEGAADDFLRSIREEPEALDAYELRAEVLSEMGRPEEAHAIRTEGERMADDLRARSRDLYERAAEAMRLDSWQPVVPLLTELIALHPTDDVLAYAYFYRSIGFMKQLRLMDALFDMVRSIRHHVMYSLFYYEYVYSIPKAGLAVEAALADAARVIEQSRRSPESVFLLSVLLALRISVAGDPAQPGIAPTPAEIEACYAEGLRLGDEILADDPASSSTYLVRSILACETGDLENAERWAGMSIALNPLAGGLAHYVVARCRARVGDLGGAMASLREACEVTYQGRPMGFHTADWVAEDPALADLRQFPDFPRLLERMRQISQMIWR